MLSLCHTTSHDLAKVLAFAQLAQHSPTRTQYLVQQAMSGQLIIAQHSEMPEIVGYAVFNYGFYDNGFVPLIYVLESQRRHGVGAALLQQVENTCATAKLFSSTNASNTPMQALFGKLGYRHCGALDALDEGDPEWLYVKQVAPPPTPDMIAYFEARTQAHIARVQHCLGLLARVLPNGGPLLERAQCHDASKFAQYEREPYIWLTEYHRCRRTNQTFHYPRGMAERVKAAIAHHQTHNRHHPEFHTDVNDMSELDLIEMVCDWTAMSMEYEPEIASARPWADNVIGTKLHFQPDKRQFVYKMIGLLDSKLTTG
ncbi:MAG: DUF5662 family protein [Anaerolineae bacterium]|nr:DUF5662 family protein [Anaerolineae bacterium]